MSEAKPKVIAIVGPTASGKTSLSIEIAGKFNGEVISADSRQIYKGMDIGTGKVTTEEMKGVPHYLLDIVDPMDAYTAVDFKRDATAAISHIRNKNHLPIIAGGTFFYLDQLRGKTQSAPVEPNPEFRNTLAELSNEELFEKLQEADPARAATIDKDNRRRLERSLEIIEELGTVPKPKKTESQYEWLIIGVDVPKETLRKNFKKRLLGWLDEGFIDEVNKLIEQGISEERFTELGFEYTLMLSFINGEIAKEELVEKFIQKNWQYAKRQMTWLKRDKEVEWYAPENRSAIFRRVTDFLAE